jgi:hypothetical protein
MLRNAEDLENNISAVRKDNGELVVGSAPTAWDFSQDLGNLGVNLGFGDFTLKSWDFTVVKEIKLFM